MVKPIFKFRRSQAMVKAKVNMEIDDILINYTTEETMIINKDTRRAWCGPCEKDARFVQFIIEGTTDEGDIVVDCTASTGMDQFYFSFTKF